MRECFSCVTDPMSTPEAQEDDGEPFEGKMRQLVAQLREQTAQGITLDEAIARNLKELGYG